jgi:hypothetical protein
MLTSFLAGVVGGSSFLAGVVCCADVSELALKRCCGIRGNLSVPFLKLDIS